MPALRGHGDAASRNGRNRRPISCLTCRHRKLRCDRALPACSNCVNRGDITTCSYTSRKPDSRTKPQPSPDLSETAHGKIDRLERLVLTLLKNQQQTQGQVDKYVDAENDEEYDHADMDKSDQESHGKPGPINQRTTTGLVNSSTAIKISADYKQCLSIDEAHWALLLNEIGDVRSYVCAQQKQYDEQTKKISQILRRSSDAPGPTLLFGSTRNVSRSEILSQLPSRYSCDILVARFFVHLYPAVYILHGPTFQKQYEGFWTNEGETSIVWVALLFAILRIAMIDYIREGDEPVEYKGKCQDLAVSFRNRLTDCLILADYMQPHDFLIEAMILHLYAEYVSSRDAKSSVWVLIGMIVRLAMRMGYHQPSQPTLTSTPFQAEMRRRAWAFIRQADILLSFQMGLPSMIGPRSLAIECSLPRNIHDDKGFLEDCTVLPPALPDCEPTKISFLIAKTKLAFGFARAVKEINRTDTVRWERILEIDRELRHIYDNVPSHYKLGQLSNQDSLVLISSRFVLSGIHHKSLCVLHSRFLEIAKSDYKYLYSRRVCLSSAMSLLRFQAIQNQEIPVDGRLRSLTNYQTSLAIHDYLLGATIISADLCSNSSPGNSANQQVSQGVPTRAEMIKALHTSAQIFSQMRDQSMEAYKAADVLEMLVKKFEGGEHNTVRTRKDVQRFQTGQSSGSEGNGLLSNSVSSHRQTSPQSFSNVTDKSSSTSLDTGMNSEAIISQYPQHLLHDPARVSQIVHAGSSNMGRPALSGVTNFDVFSTWPGTQEGEAPPFPQIFPSLEASGGWEIPGDMELFADVNSDSMSSKAANPFSYSAALALNDPMSTLWNLSSENQGGF